MRLHVLMIIKRSILKINNMVELVIIPTANGINKFGIIVIFNK